MDNYINFILECESELKQALDDLHEHQEAFLAAKKGSAMSKVYFIISEYPEAMEDSKLIQVCYWKLFDNVELVTDILTATPVNTILGAYHDVKNAFLCEELAAELATDYGFYELQAALFDEDQDNEK